MLFNSAESFSSPSRDSRKKFKKWKGGFRLPEGVLELSGIKGAGMGFKLKEDVRAGAILSIYARNIISEADAEILKVKVCCTQTAFYA